MSEDDVKKLKTSDLIRSLYHCMAANRGPGVKDQMKIIEAEINRRFPLHDGVWP